MKNYIKKFAEISNSDVSLVGGKNASLGEMFCNLKAYQIDVPDGFSVTAAAYWDFLDAYGLRNILADELHKLDLEKWSNLQEVGANCRKQILSFPLPDLIIEKIQLAYRELNHLYGSDISLAIRSSATAEDLPTASFAGQQETYLNVKGERNITSAVHHCFASLFTDRAIKYRVDNGFDHMKVALSVGIQIMVRSDKGSSGVMFTLDPDSGFENVALISSAWGLGENVVQGNINTDEFLVYKSFIGKVKNPIISRKMGSKEKTMVYTEFADENLESFGKTITNLATPEDQKNTYSLSDKDVIQLAEWACRIEKHYGRHMDVEWAKDGISGNLYIVQARPETVHSRKSHSDLFKEFKIKKKGTVVCKGIGLGNRITSGVARLLHSTAQMDQLHDGEILVTERTDPDWDPILKKAAAIITDQGGRTSHAAIVAREVGAIAVVGAGNATTKIKDGQIITVSTAEGDSGMVYDGALEWEEKTLDIGNIKMPRTAPMLILAHPDQAFKYSFFPNKGVGLMRMEFIINNAIGIHPMALKHFEKITDPAVRETIENKTEYYADKTDYFIQKLAESTARIAAAFYPKDVIVRMSDFKSNEYANLLGGRQFEPEEENPMIGFRGASRYYHPMYKEGFEMECEAMKMVREEMGFTNVKLMIPFCRTVDEAKKVIAIMADHGLKRGTNGLHLYMMVEIPSNAILAEFFAPLFDGFSIGSNDLTQLTLGADRDSTLLSEIFTPFDPAVMELIRMSVEKAKKAGVKIGLCGQAPSDYPEYAKFLVDCGMDSISFNPDALIKGIENMYRAENTSATSAYPT
ncbi:MAG: phosphoenolpyruvate synthase [Bacteroidetes bacterium]|nr:phosphoenolpyruvate synthase [Bacteroidota bacterium]